MRHRADSSGFSFQRNRHRRRRRFAGDARDLPGEGRTTRVVNSGAWQRTASKEWLLREQTKRNIPLRDVLVTFGLEDLPPCYGVVRVQPPLTVTREAIDRFAVALQQTLAEHATGRWSSVAAAAARAVRSKAARAFG